MRKWAERFLFFGLVTPHLDYLLYFEKPMMFVWMEALSQKAFGVNETASRIPPCCALSETVFSRLACRVQAVGKRAGLISALVLTTAVEFLFLQIQQISTWRFLFS
jgi:4-amino-4-deoxy-L-arabinose transferase-like glycosyltransferase